MLRSLKNMQDYKIHAKDGDIGSVETFIFDDQNWKTRYFVADIGNWLSEKMVLMSPYVIDEAVGSEEIIYVKLTKEKIRKSRHIEEDKPVFLKKELEKKKEQHIFLLPKTTTSGAYGPPHVIKRLTDERAFGFKEKDIGHLRSTKEVIGYKIHAKDGEIGHVEDFIVEDKLTWIIYYMVVDTGHWLPGKKVLVSPRWITRVNWNNKEVEVDLIKDKIKDCPEYKSTTPVNREYETLLFDYYGKPRYWE